MRLTGGMLVVLTSEVILCVASVICSDEVYVDYHVLSCRYQPSSVQISHEINHSVVMAEEYVDWKGEN